MKLKKILAACLASTLIIGASSVSISAYIDGDREVGYYSFDALGDNTYGVSNTNIKRLYNRNYVVSVTSASSNGYGLIYWACQSSGGSRISNKTSTIYAAGNTGGSYTSSSSVGTYVGLDAEVSSLTKPGANNAQNTYQSGQWSPDNAV